MKNRIKYLYLGLVITTCLSFGNQLSANAVEESSTRDSLQMSQSSDSLQQTESESTIATVDSSTIQSEATESSTQQSEQQPSENKIAEDISVKYKTHVQTYGWQSFVTNGATSGTEGQGKRLEGIQIDLSDPTLNSQIEYRTHVQSFGWQNYVQGGNISGTEGQAKRLEAIQIRLTGEMAQTYDIYYRVHSQKFGWLGWAKNGSEAGTQGYALRLEGIQIQLVKKDSPFTGSTNRPYIQYSDPTLTFTSHVQTYGWLGNSSNNEITGKTGEAKRMEAIKMNAGAQNVTGGISYSSHVQSIGWQNYVSDGALSGTQGQAKRMEAIKIKLTGELAQTYDIYYRVHIQTYGWLGWTSNDSQAGSTGGSKRIEAVQIRLVRKGLAGPALGKAFIPENEMITPQQKEQAEIQNRLNKKPYYYSQLDGRWSGRWYGMSTFGPSGCVPTSMAMVLRGHFGVNVTPVDTANRIYSYGGFNQGYFGASGTDLVRGLNSYGRSVTTINSLAELNNYLSKGYPVIMFVNVGIGHAVVAHGYSNGGYTTVYDPYGKQFYNGTVATGTLWSTPSKDSIDWSAGRPYFVIR